MPRSNITSTPSSRFPAQPPNDTIYVRSATESVRTAVSLTRRTQTPTGETCDESTASSESEATGDASEHRHALPDLDSNLISSRPLELPVDHYANTRLHENKHSRKRALNAIAARNSRERKQKKLNEYDELEKENLRLRNELHLAKKGADFNDLFARWKQESEAVLYQKQQALDNELDCLRKKLTLERAQEQAKLATEGVQRREALETEYAQRKEALATELSEKDMELAAKFNNKEIDIRSGNDEKKAALDVEHDQKMASVHCKWEDLVVTMGFPVQSPTENRLELLPRPSMLGPRPQSPTDST